MNKKSRYIVSSLVGMSTQLSVSHLPVKNNDWAKLDNRDERRRAKSSKDIIVSFVSCSHILELDDTIY